MNYRKKNYRGKRSYSGRPHRRTADSYHQPLPTDQNRIPYSRHTLTKPDVEAVVDALLSGTLTQGRELDRFESLLAKLTHSEYAIAFSSGTSSIHAALACLKLEPEDEVIIPTLTFSSVANMVRLTGASIVLVDCDPVTHTLCVEGTRKAVTENTKAIFTNNFGGHPSDLQAFRELCDEHNLMLLEDASHGLGGKYRGHYVGNQADLTCFSFHPSKAITTCEGGAVTTNNRAIAEWLRQFRHHGIQKESRFFSTNEEMPEYYQELQFSGMNYRLSEIHAALGRSQLTRLDRHIDRRRSIAHVYSQKLASVAQVVLPQNAEWADNAYHLFPVEFTGELEGHRDAIFKEMKAAGIDVQVHYVPLHRMPMFSDWSAADFPNAETYFKRCLSLPLFCDLSYKDLDRITDAFFKAIEPFLPGASAGAEESEELQGEFMEAPTDTAGPAEEMSYLDTSSDGPEAEEDEASVEDTPVEVVEQPQEPVLEEEPEPEQVEVEAKPARAPRKRATRAPRARKVAEPKAEEAGEASGEESATEEAPKKPVRKRATRTRTKKTGEGDEDATEEAKAPVRRRTRKAPVKPKADGGEDETEAKPKTTRRRTTRARKEPVESTESDS